MSSSSSSSAAANPTSFSDILNSGSPQSQKLNQGITIGSFLASLGSALIVFGLNFVAFLIIKNSLERIYLPRTFLVPEKERTPPPPKGLFQWIPAVFKTSDSEFISKCGLDAYFFLRYLRTLIRIFLPLALVILPILLPVNIVGGRGPNFATYPFNSSSWTSAGGMDQLAWGNVSPYHNQRYWAHLVLAVMTIAYTCWIFFDELKGYIRLRQAYLTSPQHRLRASATTVLITAIPSKWCTHEALDGLYDVFPGGIRNIWINRNFDDLAEKISERDQLAKTLESAETNLIRLCKEKANEKAKKEAKKKGNRKSKADLAQELKEADKAGVAMAQTDGISAGNPHQLGQTIDDILNEPSGSDESREASPQRKKPLVPIPVIGQGVEAVGQGIETLGRAVFARGGDKKEKEVKKEADAEKKEKKKKKKKDEEPKKVYDAAYDKDYNPADGDPKWQEYIKKGDRETSRLPIFGWKWMISLPLLGKKVDTIDYCRKELARLNLEIEEDQKHPDNYPLMNSAFVQFNHQVAAHMACQSVSHHLPKQMAPRVVEINPGDVIWDNMALKWWESYIRTGLVLLLIIALVVGWAIPVTATGFISKISNLEAIQAFHWISKVPNSVLSLVQGILPPALLALLLVLLPFILRFLARVQGCLNGMAVELTVQRYYFSFLFVQLFLVVSISSGIGGIIPQLTQDPQSVPALLATNLPKASNYFFSYMLLQAFSVSGGALVQLGELAKWYLLAPIMDSTARQKWRRQINLPDVRWGKFFPVYTNLACIGLIYSVVSPLILVFNVITFSLFWFVYRYNTLYVTKFRFDTGGLLFPTAINQLFTGLYVMELCLIGLFFLVRDFKIDPKTGQAIAVGSPCKAHGIIMIITAIFTIIYQYLLNSAFSPLFRYLPITLEDEAVMRDEEFARAQEKRWALEEEEEEARESDTIQGSDRADASQPREHSRSQERTGRGEESIEMQNLEGGPDLVGDLKKLLPPNPLNHQRGSWADRNKSPQRSNFVNPQEIASYIKSTRRRRRARPRTDRDLESQQHTGADRIGEALFSGINDEIEDLTPDDRDKLVRRAFQHAALRARRPVIWVPRDDLGVSDDEIQRTQKLSPYIWISNEGTGLDAKNRVIYRRSPPDFSEIDLIEL